MLHRERIREDYLYSYSSKTFCISLDGTEFIVTDSMTGAEVERVNVADIDPLGIEEGRDFYYGTFHELKDKYILDYDLVLRASQIAAHHA